MEDKDRTKEQLMNELVQLRRRVAELETSESKLKRVEYNLRRSEEKYSTLVEKGNDGIIIIQDTLLEFVNSKMVEISGFSKEEVIGKRFIDFVAPEDRALVIDRYKRRIAGEDLPSKYEVGIISADGQKIPVEINPSIVEYEGRPATIAIIRDITERKQAEEELKKYSENLEEMVEERTKELQEAQEALMRQEKLAVLGQLAGGVSHELRNPLGAIKNAAYFLNMVLEEPEPEVKETLEILEREVTTSEHIISSLLDFVRPKPPMRRKVNVNEVIQEMPSRIRMPENIEIVSQLDETSPMIMADPDQLGQIFTNITLNAIQAMPEGGQLVVKSEVSGPEWVTVAFTDTGMGISEENLGKLFEPLFTSKARGIGLGLTLAKTLAEKHGGTIVVESEVGKGSTFMVRLPVGDKEEK